MRKILILSCTLAAIMGLTSLAYADMIAVDPPEAYTGGWLAILSVVIVLIVTIELLKRFWRRK